MGGIEEKLNEENGTIAKLYKKITKYNVSFVKLIIDNSQYIRPTALSQSSRSNCPNCIITTDMIP